MPTWLRGWGPKCSHIGEAGLCWSFEMKSSKTCFNPSWKDAQPSERMLQVVARLLVTSLGQYPDAAFVLHFLNSTQLSRCSMFKLPRPVLETEGKPPLQIMSKRKQCSLNSRAYESGSAAFVIICRNFFLADLQTRSWLHIDWSPHARDSKLGLWGCGVSRVGTRKFQKVSW